MGGERERDHDTGLYGGKIKQKEENKLTKEWILLAQDRQRWRHEENAYILIICYVLWNCLMT